MSKSKSNTRAPLPESWEEAANSSSSSSSPSPSPPQTPVSASAPRAPRPTHTTPYEFPSQDIPGLSGGQPHTDGVRSSGGGTPLGRRPAKQVAVAGRIIAGALGVKAPPRSEEARAYDRAARAKEKKRLERERELKRLQAEEAEKAKKEVWDG